MPPATQKALVLPAEKASFELVTDWPVTLPGPTEVLVKPTSAALNPADAFIKDNGGGPLVPAYPFILGVDGAGVIEEVGSELNNVAKGERVMVRAGLDVKRSTFKEYAVFPAAEVLRFPANISFDEAATIPLAFATAVTGIWAHGEGNHSAELTPPWYEGGTTKYAGKAALILGGSTSVGQFVIQCARMQNFSPIIATSSIKHEEYLKSLGATHVIDRSLSFDEIKNTLSSLTAGTTIELVYDPWGRDRDSHRFGYSVLAPGGAFVHVNPFAADWLADLVAESEKKGEDKRVALSWSSYNSPGNKELGKEIFDRLPGWLETGVIVPNRFEVLPNGLAGVDAGLERMSKGLVSGIKLTVHPAETL
ncbi:GroES-like protein [Dichomitus squalens LYAD-421 SS1]|uniref:GroES-like protein n=1 Tax=Dichomitus squalens (strain LYAD-421) TaxID=732165 RepID=R7SJH9_DICSQ|nr:GroES-like protein [Dichomitus squalens LYAD-421 SS1]EJF55885.1 GroES-like protein [Dichomitus squalens LYAD-421 SS1]